MLTQQQEAFVERYLEIRNATQAAKDVGYAHPNVQGPRMLKHPDIRAAIEIASAEACKNLGITTDFVIKETLDLFMRAKAAVKPKLNSKTGKPIKDEGGSPVYTEDRTTQLKCIELLGKHLGMWDQGADASDAAYRSQVEAIRSRFKVVGNE